MFHKATLANPLLKLECLIVFETIYILLLKGKTKYKNSYAGAVLDKFRRGVRV